MGGDGIERELKFPCPEVERVKVRLAELEAERLGAAAFEDNQVFDLERRLEASGCLLRLRSDRHGSRLTFKGPARFEGRMKIREERETRVEDAETMRRVLESVGFEIVRRYQKKREEWSLGGVTVSLDHTPIGDFVEFEGEGAETVARRCGFDPGEAEPRSYLALYEAYLREHPDAPAEMVFS